MRFINKNAESFYKWVSSMTSILGNPCEMTRFEDWSWDAFPEEKYRKIYVNWDLRVQDFRTDDISYFNFQIDYDHDKVYRGGKASLNGVKHGFYSNCELEEVLDIAKEFQESRELFAKNSPINEWF